MEYVHPIRDTNHINRIKQFLHHHSYRDYLFFVIGINTGLRLNDLLQLKVSDIWNGKDIVEFIHVSENDPNFYLNNNVKQALQFYLNETNPHKEEYLFKSKKSNLPITRQQAYRIINQATNAIGLKDKYGAHTLRKTFGYHAYRKGVAISLLQKIFHHRTKAETLDYIGINKNEQVPLKIDVNL
jgi:integrase